MSPLVVTALACLAFVFGVIVGMAYRIMETINTNQILWQLHAETEELIEEVLTLDKQLKELEHTLKTVAEESSTEVSQEKEYKL